MSLTDDMLDDLAALLVPRLERIADLDPPAASPKRRRAQLEGKFRRLHAEAQGIYDELRAIYDEGAA